MFKCDECGKNTEPGMSQHKKIIETRPRVYSEYDKKAKEDVEIGRGSEIVQEISVCSDCQDV